MRSQLTLIIDVEHPEGFDPADHFVYYFADDHDYIPDREDGMFTVREDWETIK